MKFTIQEIHVDITDSFREHLLEKLDKLEAKFDWIIKGEVFLRKDNFDNKRDKIIEIRLSIPGENIFAERRESSWREADQKVFEAVRRQLKKHKEKDFGHPVSSDHKHAAD